MPRGWPVPELMPPAGSEPFGESLAAANWGGGAVQWSQDFTAPVTWQELTAAIETELSGRFQRLTGKENKEPDLNADGSPKMGAASGERTYRSKDGRVAVFVRGNFQKQPSMPKGPTTTYGFQIVIFDQETPLGPNSKLEDL
jgi:hypothetical protein